MGISNPALRQFLSHQFNSPFGNDNNFLAKLVFELMEANQAQERLADLLLGKTYRQLCGIAIA